MSGPVLIFAPETFNIAETTRMIEIAKAAKQHFTVHFMGYGGAFVHLVEDEGFEFHLLEPQYSPDKIEHLWKIDRMETFGQPFTVDEVRQRVSSELALFQELQPAAIVMGFTLTVAVSARVAEIPLVAVTPFAFTRAFFEAGLATFPDQFRRGPLKWLPRTWLDKVVIRWALRSRAWTRNFNRVLEEHGRSPFSTLMELWEGDHMLIAEAPEVTGVELPDGWTYVGPIFAKLAGEVPQDVLDVQGRRPLIYSAMGSSGNQVLVGQVIEAFQGMECQVVAPVQAHIEGADVTVPENVLVTDWLPAPQVNAMADLAVIHGGQGTVQTACAAGTPFVGIGLQPEQEWNIDFFVRRGCAIRLSRREVTPDALRRAVEALLNDPCAKEVAERMQDTYRQWNGPQRTADYLVDHFFGAEGSA